MTTVAPDDDARRSPDPLRPRAGAGPDAATTPDPALRIERGDSAADEAEPWVVHVSGSALTVAWRPGHVRLVGTGEPPDAVEAVTRFDAAQRELESLDNALGALEAAAGQDLAIAFEMRAGSKRRRAHLVRHVQGAYSLRLRLARLTATLPAHHLALSCPARRLLERLHEAALSDEVLEAVSDRLEVVENLYEGAVDRLNDKREWGRSSRLELAIIVLLLLEIVESLVAR